VKWTHEGTSVEVVTVNFRTHELGVEITDPAGSVRQYLVGLSERWTTLDCIETVRGEVSVMSDHDAIAACVGPCGQRLVGVANYEM
jgi:hypothetical protein